MNDGRPPIRDPAIIKRVQVAFDLYETAQMIMRQNLRRRHPDAGAAEIERRLVEWRHHRSGAEYGDGVGRPVRRHEIDEWLASRKH